MVVEGLTMPPLLDELLTAGRWPRDHRDLQRKFISEDCRRNLRKVQLFPPPFHTYAAFAAKGWDSFFGQFGAIHELVPECTICIADFGHGSDSPIVLDFQFNRVRPRVIYLHWPGGGVGENYGKENYWAALSPDFTSFVEMLGL